jgi:hypothetical protein
MAKRPAKLASMLIFVPTALRFSPWRASFSLTSLGGEIFSTIGMVEEQSNQIRL